MATILLKDTYRSKFYETCVLRLERGKSLEVSAPMAVSYLGVEHLEVKLNEEEINSLNDKRLNNALRHLGLKTKDDLLVKFAPKKTITKTVTDTVKAVAPSLNKKVKKEEPSDKATLADKSE